LLFAISSVTFAVKKPIFWSPNIYHLVLRHSLLLW
jgi:hypothetical protein